MITDPQNMSEIIDKLSDQSQVVKQKSALNVHKRKGMKQQFKLFGNIAIIAQQIVLVFTFTYLAAQKVVYRIPLECQLIFDHSLCKISLTSMYVIIFLRICRNILKIYKTKKENTSKLLTYSYLYNRSISFASYRYYLGVKILIVTLFAIQFVLENYLILAATTVWAGYINQNINFYFASAILIQVMVCDLIYEFVVIYGGRYSVGNSKRNSISIRLGCCYESFCKFKLLTYSYQFYKLTQANYKVYTRNKGIPIF